MPRMSNKKRVEMSFYINRKGRVEHNRLCLSCANECKQSYNALVISCNKYHSKRNGQVTKSSH